MDAKEMELARELLDHGHAMPEVKATFQEARRVAHHHGGGPVDGIVYGPNGSFKLTVSLNCKGCTCGGCSMKVAQLQNWNELCAYQS